MKEYTYHIDAGHGYLEVPLADALRLGLTLKRLSRITALRGSLNCLCQPSILKRTATCQCSWALCSPRVSNSN